MANIDTPYSKPLDLKQATVLVTGGSSGIGLGLAAEFLKAGSTVIVIGRRTNLLEEAKKLHPALITHQADVATAEDRAKLAQWAISTYPKLNVLVNNAGVQRQVNLVDDIENWAERQVEIDINVSGPVHLTHLFSKHLLAQPEAAILNVSSGLAFVPAPFVAAYSATKAFLHSYTLSTRVAFSKTNVHVVEIVPPAVKTRLGGNHNIGEDCDEFCASVFKRFAAGEKEIGFKFAEDARLQTREKSHGVLQYLSSTPMMKYYEQK